MFVIGEKVNTVQYLMKRCSKVKGKQVITFQMAQQLLCLQCKAKFLLKANSLY